MRDVSLYAQLDGKEVTSVYYNISQLPKAYLVYIEVMSVLLHKMLLILIDVYHMQQMFFPIAWDNPE